VNKIYKIQLPISSSDPIPTALLYDKDRTEMEVLIVTPKLRRFMGKALIKFAYIKNIDDVKTWKKARHQKW